MLTSDARLREVLADRLHGSRTIASGILQTLKRDLADQPVSRPAFVELARFITARVPSFALVFDLLHAIGHAAFTATESVSAKEFRGHLIAWQDQWEAAGQAMVATGTKVLSTAREVATFSSSGAVLHALAAAASDGLRPTVVGSVAEPGREGEHFLQEVATLGLPVKLVADHELSERAASCDLVLIGSDAVFPDRFWNKVGTAALCRATRTALVPVYVAAETQKWVPAAWGLHIAASGGALFEATPLSIIHGVVSDQGLVVPGAIRPLIEAKPACSYLISD